MSLQVQPQVEFGVGSRMRSSAPLARLAGVGLRLGLTSLFAVAPRLFVDVELHGIEHDTRAPRTYFAITHKRDLDSMAPLPGIVWHGGWRRIARDLHFAMRADSFEPGFLSRVVRRPAWFSRALHPLSVALVLDLVGVHPLIGIHTRPAESWIRDVLAAEGDLRASDVLAPVALQVLARAAGEPAERIGQSRLPRVLAWRSTRHLPLLSGPDLLAGMVRRRAERRAVAAAKARLAEMAEWLRAGGSIYSAPEGGFSTHGRLGPITAGFHRLLRTAPSDTRVVPIAIVYDFMTARRMRMLVDFAPALTRASELPSRELDARLRDAWRRAARFTCTQLGAAFLVERGQSADPAFGEAELATAVAERAQTLAAAGRHVDARLLAPAGVRRAAAAFLAYAVRHGVAERAGAGRWRATPGELEFAVAPGEVGYSRWPLAYAWNEYRELLSLEAANPSPVLPSRSTEPTEPTEPTGRTRRQSGA